MKWTIERLEYARESEDKVEFKKGEHGNIAYDGGAKVKPGDTWPANFIFTANGVTPRVVRGSCMTFHNNHNIPMFGRLRFCEKP